MREAQYRMSASNCTAGSLLRSYTDRTIDMSDHQVHRLSEFYPYAILKPKGINCDRVTWLKDPMSRLHTETVLWTGSRHFYKTTCIIKQTHSVLQFLVFYRRWAITITYRPDYRQEWSSKWPCQYNRLSEFYPYAKLKPKEINFERDTWLTEPMSRLLTDTVQWTGSRQFHKTNTCLGGCAADVDARPWEQRTINRSCVSAGIWETTWYRRTMSGRRETRASGGGGGGRRQALQLPASVRADGRLTGRQTTLHLLGSRRQANGHVAVLGGDKRATITRSDGQVLSLFRRQSDGAVGKTVRQ